MDIVLKLYTYVDGVNDTPFPNAEEQAMFTFTYDANRMGGSPQISATVKHRLCLDDLWNDKVYATFRGEKYFIMNTPSSDKDNTDQRYKHDIQLLSEREVLNHVYFIDAVQGDSTVDVYKSNSTKVIFFGDVNEFVSRLNACLSYQNLDYTAVLDSGVTSEDKQVSFEDKYILEALQEIFNVYEIPYYFVGKVIHVGFTENTITYPLKYGFDEALLSISKQNANYALINKIKGQGSSDNIPYYYPNESDDREAIEAAGKKWITPMPNLMPSIYRESKGAEQFYEAKNNTYSDGEGGYYEFENEYSDTNQRQGTTDFEDIKPTIEGMTNASGQRIDMFSAFAYDKNDNDETDEDGNYIHSYFFAKLRKFDGENGFNLFDHAIESQPMQISFTSGVCGACTFEIGVGEETQKNIVQVDEFGNLLRDEEGNVLWENQSPQDRQNDTQNYEVWIALKKEDSTYGIVFPNASQNLKPSTDDTFVILGINLPTAYITAAEKRLEQSLIKYMWMNNTEKFTFSIKFSRIFFTEHPEVLEQLNENSRVLIEYNGIQHTLYVDNFSYKTEDSSPLPEIEIDLVDTLSVGQNSLQTQLDSVKQDILSSIGGGDFLKQGLKYFLRKDVADTAQKKITFREGIDIGVFEGDISGGTFRKMQDGTTYAELDKIKVRVKAYFETLEIQNINSVGGKQIITPGGGVYVTEVVDRETVDGTEVVWDYYRCYFLTQQDGREIENRFKVGDLAISQNFNVREGTYSDISNHYYWREVVGVGDDYIDLSKSICDTESDAPASEDVICQLGNRIDVDRQGALIFSSVDEFSPSITLYQGINDFSYVDKDYVSYGLDKTTGKAFFRVYGEMYVGDREQETYIKYTQDNGVEIKGKLAIGTTLGDGKTIEQALSDATQSAIDTSNENISEFTDAVTKDIENLQNQIDGAIETWFDEPAPTLSNYPANEWLTNEEKNVHLGDLYYSGEGKAYRFQMDGESYVWKLITDSDITKALADAEKAQDTADGKRTVFVKQPTDSDSYQIGDLWVNATYGTTYENDVLRAVSEKLSGSPFSINHWTKASKYTDDTKAEEVQQNVGELATSVNTLSGTISGMQNFTDEAFKDGIVDRSEASSISTYLNNIKSIQNSVTESYNKIYNNSLLDGTDKTNLLNAYSAFKNATNELIQTIEGAIADGLVDTLEKASVDGKYDTFNTKYGDFIAYINAANKYIQDKINANALDALNKIGEMSYITDALKQYTTIEGGLIQSSLLALGYTDSDGFKVMSGTNGIYNSDKLGGGIASWWGGAMFDRFEYTEETMPSNVATGLVRFDGTGYFANGNLWWEKDGTLHADPLSFFVGEETVGDVLGLFQFVKDGNTTQYVIPQYPFQKLEVANDLRIGKAYLKWDETNNALYVVGEDGSSCNFYSLGELSAGGFSDEGGSGGGNLFGIIVNGETYTPENGYITLPDYSTAASVLGIKVNGSTYKPVDGYITIPDYPTELAWGAITGKPTTIEGYGITDAYTKAESDGKYFRFVGYATNDGEETLWQKLGTKAYVRSYPDGMIHKIYSYGVVASFGAGGYATFELYANHNSSNPAYINDGLQFRSGYGDDKKNWRIILDEINYANYMDTRYVKKSGDTMVGSLNTADFKSGQDSGGTYIEGTNHTSVRLQYMLSSGDYDQLKLVNRSMLFNDNVVWHAGNDGAGSGLDADLLDGYHASYGSNTPWGTIPVIHNGGWIDIGKQIEFHFDDTTASDYSTVLICTGNYSNKVYLPSSSGTLALITDNVASATKLQTPRTIWGQSFDGTNNISGELNGCTRVKNTSHQPIYLGNGDNTSWVYTQDIASQQGYSYWAIKQAGNSWFKKVSIGYTNADEGSFPLNVRGTISSTSLSTGNIRIECDNNGVLGDRRSEINNYNTSLYLQHNTATNLICCMGGGNVGIGTDSPSYKLHVAGTLYTSGGATFTGRTTHNGGISAGYSNTTYRISTDSFICNSWVRTNGNSGWFNETYGGGIYMENSTWVRVYNGKAFLCDNTIQARGGFHSTSDSVLRFGSYTYQNLITWLWTSDLGDHVKYNVAGTNDQSIYMQLETSGVRGLHVFGNVVAAGEVTAGSSSDARLKTILKKQDYAKRLLDLGMVVDYTYNDLAFSRNVRSIERRRYTGLIYQNVKDVLPQMAGEDADGYGYLNYIHTDYINLIAGALQQTILKQETIEQRVERLEKENAELKNKIATLAA